MAKLVPEDQESDESPFLFISPLGRLLVWGVAKAAKRVVVTTNPLAKQK
jgi:hypothetical protein